MKRFWIIPLVLVSWVCGALFQALFLAPPEPLVGPPYVRADQIHVVDATPFLEMYLDRFGHAWQDTLSVSLYDVMAMTLEASKRSLGYWSELDRKIDWRCDGMKKDWKLREGMQEARLHDLEIKVDMLSGRNQ